MAHPELEYEVRVSKIVKKHLIVKVKAHTYIQARRRAIIEAIRRQEAEEESFCDDSEPQYEASVLGEPRSCP